MHLAICICTQTACDVPVAIRGKRRRCDSPGNLHAAILPRKIPGQPGRLREFCQLPGQPIHARLQWAWERNTADQPDFDAVNIEMKEVSAMVLKSVLADQPVWFSANSSAEGDKGKGLWLQDIEDKSDLFGVDFLMSKADALAYDDGAPDHAMVITGVDVRNGVPVKSKVENSWGTDKGDAGWFIIDSQWFDRHVFQVIIERKFVPPDLLALTKQKPIVLPPWDPFTDWEKGR